MSDEIRVTVRIWAQNRPLMLTWTDPVSGKTKTKTSGTFDWGEAERLAGELEKQLRAGATVTPSKVTWQEFRKRFREEKLAGMNRNTQDAYGCALDQVDRVLAPGRLCKLTTGAITTFVTKLRKEGMKATTLNKTLRHVKAALRWAQRQGYLETTPHVDMLKTAGKMKGRPITTEEYERMLDKARVVRPDDAAQWQRFITGLWLSGLRLSEAIVLNWTEGPFRLDLDSRHPRFAIDGTAQKSGKAELSPCTPDFAEWLLDSTPEGERVGPVFPMVSYKGSRLSVGKVGQVVSDIGEAAGVVVARAEKIVRGNKRQPPHKVESVKFASAHDLRRAFGNRWAKRLAPAMLQKLMRHSHITTTMQHYVNLDADDIAAELWRGHDSGAIRNISRNIGQESRVGDEPRS